MYPHNEEVKFLRDLPILILQANLTARGDQLMYSLFLVVCVALVILSPLALELLLTVYEGRAERRRILRRAAAQSPGLVWASPRLR